jgi:protein gp37
MAGIGQYWTKAGNVTWGDNNDDYCLSEACVNCYARRMHEKFAKMNPGMALYQKPFSEVQLRPQVLNDFKKWRGEVVFVSNMSDLFNVNVPDQYILNVFAAMRTNPQNTYLVITKRTRRMKEFIEKFLCAKDLKEGFGHVWFGTTAENERRCFERVTDLLAIDDINRLVSVEPLLEKFTPLLFYSPHGRPGTRIDLIICGGESGPNARPTRREWFEHVYKTCKDNGVRYVHKQDGDNYQDEPVSYLDDIEVFRQPFIRQVA